VTAGALLGRGGEIATGLVASITGSAGQLCTKPGVVFVPDGPDGDRFESTVEAELAQLGSFTLLNRQVRDRLVDRIAALLGSARALGEEPPPGDGEGFSHPPRAFEVTAAQLVAQPALAEECFGPVVLFVRYADLAALADALGVLGGQLTATIHFEATEASRFGAIVAQMTRLAGRVIFNAYPTGVAVTHAMEHGGPYPASTSPFHTSVGMAAIRRFLRPVAWQDAPPELLPPELQEHNPCGIARQVDGVLVPRP